MGEAATKVKVAYQNTLSDLLLVSLYIYFSRKRFIVMTVFIFLLITLVNVLPVLAQDEGAKFNAVAYVAALLIILGLGNGVAAVFMLFDLLPKRNKILYLPRTLVLEDSGIVEETSEGRTEVRWSSVYKVRQTRRFILIYFSEYMLHVVPKRAFSNAAEAEGFYRFAYEAWQRASAKEVPKSN